MADIPIDALAEEIVNAFREYTEDVSEAIEAKVVDVADQVLNEVKRTAPGPNRNYAKGFTKTKKALRGGRYYVIWNKKNYRLVHLLEFGHAKVNDKGEVKERPHLVPAHDKYASQLPEHIKRIIKNGGGP